jgi:hypothetical protein
MANDRNDRSDPWPAIVLIGVVCGIAIGALIVLVRRQGGGGDGERLLLNSASDDFAMPLDVVGGSRVDPMVPVRPPMNSNPPIARTQFISTTVPTFLLKANGSRDWTVHIRVIGPPGSSATFIYSGSASDRYVVPAGAHDTIRLPGWESLYALGNVAGVSVSVAGGGEGDRA